MAKTNTDPELGIVITSISGISKEKKAPFWRHYVRLESGQIVSVWQHFSAVVPTTGANAGGSRSTSECILSEMASTLGVDTLTFAGVPAIVKGATALVTYKSREQEDDEGEVTTTYVPDGIVFVAGA